MPSVPSDAAPSPSIHTKQKPICAQRVRLLLLLLSIHSLSSPDAHPFSPPPLAKEIVERIYKGEWTASQVLEAYIARATLAQDMTNCLTEGWFAL